jgi:hypothetical protein
MFRGWYGIDMIWNENTLTGPASIAAAFAAISLAARDCLPIMATHSFVHFFRDRFMKALNLPARFDFFFPSSSSSSASSSPVKR